MLAFNTQESGTHFSLYYENGENLTGLDFGPVGGKQNLTAYMSQYLTPDEAEALSRNFRDGIAGKAEFSLSGVKQMLYYSPIPETGWMITVLIPENLIYDQIGGIRDKTMTRSIIQILITCAALLAFFGVLAVRAQRESRAMLEKERKIAVRDSLTGVGNKYAYTQKENAVDQEIRSGSIGPFALVVCDLNGLKQVNDTQGHAAGDAYIREASRLICDRYKHSPVYRIGGDEFVVFLQGADYEQRGELLEGLDRGNAENAKAGGVVIAAGMAEYKPDDEHISEVFSRADHRMYERKKQLKNA
jgi:diguanylate cyclase (GGDEF)-like protein